MANLSARRGKVGTREVPWSRWGFIAVFTIIALALGAIKAQSGGDQSGAQVAADPTGAATADAGSAGRYSSLPTVTVDGLPFEALETLDLIDDSGPFPFDRDGLTFQNREGILPDKPRGHYAEYTVITPGSDDRGARRIVSGDDGARYYTDDHYNSFREIVDH